MEATTLTLRRPRVASLRPVIASVALAGLVLGSLLVAIAAAQGESRYLSPTVHLHGHPGWLTWPFGGLWPGRSDSRTQLQWTLIYTLLAMHACWGIAVWLARSVRPAIVWGAVGVVYGVLFLSPPVLLTDLFNYLGYARLDTLHGLNAYAAIPAQGPHDLVYSLSTWHYLHNPYGPLFTLLLYPLVPLGLAGAYWTLKALLAAAAIASLVMVARIARRLGRSPMAAVVLVGLNPMWLVYGAAGQHMDMLTLLPLLVAIELSLIGRERASGAASVVATAVKASAGPAVLVLIAGARERSRVAVGAAAAAAALGLVFLAVFGPHGPDLQAQTRAVQVFGVPNVLGLLIGHGGADAFVRTSMQVVFAVAAVACIVMAWRRREVLAPLGWLTVATLATLSWDMAWYIVWLLPFIAFVRSRPFRIAAIAMCVWLTIQWMPMLGFYLHQAGINPSRTKTWHENSVWEKRLVR